MSRLSASEGDAYEVGCRDRQRAVPLHERPLLSGIPAPPRRDTDVRFHRLEPDLCEVRGEEDTEG